MTTLKPKHDNLKKQKQVKGSMKHIAAKRKHLTCWQAKYLIKIRWDKYQEKQKGLNSKLNH